MRHIWSFVLSLVLAPLIWALTGLGLLVQAGGVPAIADDRARQVWLGAFVAAGVLVAVLTMARLSPLGPALAGLSFLGAVAYAPSLRLVVPDLPSGFDEALLLPADGLAIVLGIPLLATALIGGRWRRAASPPPYAIPVPAATLVSPPAPTLVSPQPPTYGAPVASTYGAPQAFAAPDDAWQPWWYPRSDEDAPAPAAAPEHQVPATTGSTSPWARPMATSLDDKTDDLSQALLPLRNGNPPPAR